MRVMPIEGEFRSRHESTWYCFIRILKQILAYFLSILSQILVDQPTYTCSKQVLHV